MNKYSTLNDHYYNDEGNQKQQQCEHKKKNRLIKVKAILQTEL